MASTLPYQQGMVRIERDDVHRYVSKRLYRRLYYAAGWRSPDDDPTYAGEPWGAPVAERSGLELAYAETVVSQQTNNVKADIADCSITFEVEEGYAVHVDASVVVSSSVVNASIIVEIANELNAVAPGALAISHSSTANATNVVSPHERITTPGIYTRKMRFQSSSATANNATTNLAGFGKAHIRAVAVPLA